MKSFARTRIKLCGITEADALHACTDAGADAIGFVFYPPSVRSVSIPQAKHLAAQLPPWVMPVALFVNPEPKWVQAVLKAIPNALLQFHGDEPPEFCAAFHRPFIKAIRVHEGLDVNQKLVQFIAAQGILLDSESLGFGGSGHIFDWNLWPQQPHQALILSGGLNENNVGKAIHTLRPYGVDVSSGIESQKGIKDVIRIHAFCQAVRAADNAHDKPV